MLAKETLGTDLMPGRRPSGPEGRYVSIVSALGTLDWK